VLGADRTARLGSDLADALPGAVGAPETTRAVIDAGASLGWVTALVALVPASLYGEGLRRAFVRLEEQDESHAGRRGRLGVLPLLAATPLLAAVVLLCAPILAALADDGAGSRALGAYLALCLGWVLLTGPTAYVYRVLSPKTPGWRACLLAGSTAAAFVAGFLQGFVLFLAIPLDLGRPFGGFVAVGACVAVALWLWVLHLVVLFGYALSRTLDTPVPAEGRSQARLVLRG
jgi:membrane protein